MSHFISKLLAHLDVTYYRFLGKGLAPLMLKFSELEHATFLLIDVFWCI